MHRYESGTAKLRTGASEAAIHGCRAAFLLAIALASLDGIASSPIGTALIADRAPLAQVELSPLPPISKPGDLVLKVSLNASGNPESVVLVAGSGKRLMDAAVLSAVRSWRFSRDASLPREQMQVGFVVVHSADIQDRKHSSGGARRDPGSST